MDVGTWLGRLGLDQYEAVFRQNRIEADTLPELSERMLRDIGVPLGHRLRILRAIRLLGGEKPIAIQLGPEAAARVGAERRHMTVVFCDLVGLTALTAKLDPEDMADLLRAGQSAIAAAVARFEGHVAKWVGDGATIYFGYPRAHEDDAERAARAGLTLIDAIAELGRARGVALAMRIGISSGLVVVGELIGEGEARERVVVGDTANLAARLRSEAEPGTILVSEATRRLLGSAFEMQRLGPQALKGFRSPVITWRVIREQENFSRFDAARTEALTPLVGRENEIASLCARWQQATQGDGQVVLLSGEAGIGKSRTVAAFRDRLDDGYHIVMRYQCSPHHLNDAFYPVIAQIRYAAGFVSGEPAGARLDKMENIIKATGLPCGEIAPSLAALLGIPTDDRYPPLEMTPAEFKERTLAALLAMTAGLSKQTPILMLLEDAHWIDPTTLDLTARVVELVRTLPILLIITHRPEFSPPWSGSHVTLLPLNRLDRLHAFRMIDGVAAGRSLPAEVIDEIVAKTDGVPLFMEELTKGVLESDLLHEDGNSYVLSSALTPLAIPSTLHDSLTARLDRLSPIKETAQIGAAIGREFPHSLLEAVSPIKGEALRGVLRQLMEAELIHCRGVPPKASYVFKHALVQDAAYGSLLRSRRQRIHARIAWALKEHVTDEEYPPATIAHHFTEAGLAAPAASAWLGAAELALSQSAPVEAERHASKGLSLIPAIPEGRERDALELSLLVARAYALVPLKSITAPETFEVMNAAKRLLDRGVGTDLQRVSVLFGLCSEATLKARMQPALDFAHQIIEVAERPQNDPTYRLVAYRMLATNQFYAGQSRLALDSLLRAKQYCDPTRQRGLSHRFGWDPSIALLAFEVLVRLSLGLIDSAAEISAQVQDQIVSHTHATTIASATFCAVTWPKAILGDLPALEAGSTELVIYCSEKRAEQIRLLATMHCAYARAMREPVADNLAGLRSAFDQMRSAGGFTGSSMILSHLAEAAMLAGELKPAAANLQQGFAFVEQSGERFWLAELHRLGGQLALRQGPDRPRAEACFRTAMEIAHGQQGRLLELRAANDLARLWRDGQSNNDVHALLEPILAAIEGGETSRDVRNARELLAALA